MDRSQDGRSYLQKLAKLIRLKEQDEQFVRKNQLAILSTLVWMGFSDWKDDYKHGFVAAKRTDDDLPMSRTELNSIHWEHELTDRFKSVQYLFKPVGIRELDPDKALDKELDARSRLPFFSHDELRFGVFKKHIAEGDLIWKSGRKNDKVSDNQKYGKFSLLTTSRKWRCS